MKIDTLDRDILSELRKDGRITIKDLAEKLNRRRATIYNRIQKLEENEIMAYTIAPDFEALGYPITVFILVSLTGEQYKDATTISDVSNKLAAISFITECYAISGEYDYLLKARVQSLDSLGTFINFKLRKLRGVRKTLTLSSFHSVLEELSNSRLLQIDSSKTRN